MNQIRKFCGSRTGLRVDANGVWSLEDAQWFAVHGGNVGFNVKVLKNGGLFNCLRIIRTDRNHHIPCQLGAQVGETSLLDLISGVPVYKTLLCQVKNKIRRRRALVVRNFSRVCGGSYTAWGFRFRFDLILKI